MEPSCLGANKHPTTTQDFYPVANVNVIIKIFIGIKYGMSMTDIMKINRIRLFKYNMKILIKLFLVTQIKLHSSIELGEFAEKKLVARVEIGSELTISARPGRCVAYLTGAHSSPSVQGAVCSSVFPVSFEVNSVSCAMCIG